MMRAEFILGLVILLYQFIHNGESIVQDAMAMQFEAAFQGKCDEESPCEQFCLGMTNGMFECDCMPGYVLRDDGYSCYYMNESYTTPNDAVFQNAKSGPLTTPFLEKLDFKENRKKLITSEFPVSDFWNKTNSENVKPCSEYCRGVCVFENVEEGRGKEEKCVCPLGKNPRDNCEKDIDIKIPRFSSQSWIALAPLKGAYMHVHVEMEFKPQSFDGVLLVTGERENLDGDYVALILHQGFLEFRFDCGSGMGIVRSEQTVNLNKWNKIILYRHRWDAYLQLNGGKHNKGKSKGMFSRITFREPVYIGGRGNMSFSSDKIPIQKGFKGCIRMLQINGAQKRFLISPNGDAVAGFDIEKCMSDSCNESGCEHGGQCVSSSGAQDDAFCVCPMGFTGDLCEIKVDLQIPMFNGSSYLRYAGIGEEGIVWLDLELIIKPMHAGSSGVLLFNGDRDVGDFVCVYTTEGHVGVAFDFGDGITALRSYAKLSANTWHRIKISRTCRMIILEVDSQQPEQIISDRAFNQLSLGGNLYVGGVPNLNFVAQSLPVNSSFVGCVQKVTINEQPLHLFANALVGVNIENCAHACLVKPCGGIHARCEPVMESYKCVCDKYCDSSQAGAIAAFDGFNFLHYTDKEIHERLSHASDTKINITFRSLSVIGMIFWYTSSYECQNVMAIGLRNGFVHVSFVEDGEDCRIEYTGKKVNDGHWHEISVERSFGEISLSVDKGRSVRSFQIIKRADPCISTNPAGLFIGGLDPGETASKRRLWRNFKGCISRVVLNSDYRIFLPRMSEDGTLCGG